MSALVPGYPAFTQFKGSADASVGGTPAAPTVAVVGTAGAQEYDYEIVAVGPGGDGIPSPIGKVTNGNAVLNGTDYNTLNWTAATPETGGYKILRRAASSGAFYLYDTVAHGVLTYNDQGAGSTSTIYAQNPLVSVTIGKTCSYEGPNGTVDFYKGQTLQVAAPVAADLIAQSLAVASA